MQELIEEKKQKEMEELAQCTFAPQIRSYNPSKTNLLRSAQKSTTPRLDDQTAREFTHLEKVVEAGTEKVLPKGFNKSV